MNKTKYDIELTKEINQLIEQNQDDIILYLEKQLIKFRELFSSEILNPWYLCFALNFEIIEKDDLDRNIKTILNFQKSKPFIYYSNKLNSSELKFYLMKEFIYYLIILYLPSEFKFENLFNKNVILDSSITENTKPTTIAEQIVYDYTIKFLIPEKAFNYYYTKTNDIKKCSEQFEVEEEIIKSYISKNIKTLKKENKNI